ncbi:virulence factor MviN [Brevibacterium luteolum]|uniref:virulence factor MviN n=1 Tax=Brevibacterium luteolum TaxID=199591 RepID=UPI003EE9FCBB
MIGIERGTVVAERYVVSDIVRPWFADHPDSGTVCIALDAILDMAVTLYVAPSETSGDLLDAARRSALLTDPRIPTVLDVGRADGLDFVVFERSFATPLPAILRNGPLAPEAARAFVGELATALAHASSRSLYHLCLGPECVGLKDNFDATVTGVAIDAAVAHTAYGLDLEAMPTAAKKREDALALMNIFYAALTGHWPSDEPRAGLPVAQRRNNRFVRVSELVDGVPSDLEEFVSGVVMKIEPGPRSASEVVRFLDEWDVHQLRQLSTGSPRPDGDELRRTEDEKFSGTEAATGASSARPTTKADPATASGAAALTPPRPATPPAAAGAPAPEKRATPAQLRAALTRIGLTRPGASGLAAGRLADSETPYDDRMQMRQAAVFPISSEQLASAETDEWQPEDTFASYEQYADAEADANETQRIADRSRMFTSDEELSADDTQVISTDQEAVEDPEADEDEDDGSWFLGGMFTTREEELERQRAEYERERRLQQEAEERARAQEQSRRKSAAAPAAGLGADLADDTAQSDATERETDQQPANPAPAAAVSESKPKSGPGRKPNATGGAATSAAAAAPAAAAGGSGGKGSRPPAEDDASADKPSRPLVPILIGVLALLVVGALIVGIIVGTQGDDEPTAEEPTAETEPTEEQPPTEEEPQGPKPVIADASALDPEGDETENDDAASNVLDDDDSAWRTDRYNSSKFGNLKSGVGLALELEESATVSQVELTSDHEGSDFEVRIGDSDDPEDATVVGKGTTEDGKTTVDLDDGAEGSVVIIWFTELGSADGGYRAYVSHVGLS